MRIKKSLAYSLILSFYLSSCSSYASHSSLVFRSPTAFNSSLENEFLLNLDKLESIFIISEAVLLDFDNELNLAVLKNKKFLLSDSKNYKKMMILWNESHQLQEKIINQYLSLLEEAQDIQRSYLTRKRASVLLAKFNLKSTSKVALSKLSWDELKINLNASLTSKGEATLSSSFKDEQEKIKILRANRAKFQKEGKRLQKLNNALIQKIEIESNDLQLTDLNQDEQKRADLKFYPSTGPNGNVVGLIFPKNVWALTYDDGPHPFHTPKIINNLKELDIKATFFWLAENIIPHQSIVDLVRVEGNATENHSWSHVQLTKASESVLNREIIESTLLDTKAYGERPRFFRCPYGAGNSVTRIRKIIADQDLIHVYWNVDSLDWQDKDPSSIVKRAKNQMKLVGHGVILFHDIHPQSVIASKELIEWSKDLKGTENEIRWVTIPEIVNELNREIQAPK